MSTFLFLVVVYKLCQLALEYKFYKNNDILQLINEMLLVFKFGKRVRNSYRSFKSLN